MKALLSVFEISLKNSPLLIYIYIYIFFFWGGGRYATKIHHFLLEIVVSYIQIDSMLRLSLWDDYLAIMPFHTKTIFPTPFESWTFLNRGNRYSSILNWLSGNLVQCLVSSMQSLSILDVKMISLKYFFPLKSLC